jgi:hypothetical protein
MVLAFRRSRMVPCCWYCGASKVAKAQVYRPSDYLPLLSFLVPLRCLGCLARFYGMRGALPASPERPKVVIALQRELTGSNR